MDNAEHTARRQLEESDEHPEHAEARRQVIPKD